MGPPHKIHYFAELVNLCCFFNPTIMFLSQICTKDDSESNDNTLDTVDCSNKQQPEINKVLMQSLQKITKT